MTQIIDRRLNSKNKSAVNRQRFIKRFREQIKQSVGDAIGSRSITDVKKGEKVHIPTKDISEPEFRHGQGGKRDIILPGNTEHIVGDKFSRPPPQGGSGGSIAGNDTDGMDEFVFEISHNEFLEFFFEDLELPELVKKNLKKIESYNIVRAGYTTDGSPSNINVVRSLKGSLARRISLRAPYKTQIEDIKQELQYLKENDDTNLKKKRALEEEIQSLKEKIQSIPFIDTFDLRYNNRVKQPKPTTQAVMFCLMDVSGSMTQDRKDLAKRFYILLYLFLTKQYQNIQVVFIRHHTTAKEVDEEEFFYSRETGGTVVSSALKLMNNIIEARFPVNDWNIYAAQTSDGDNWSGDSSLCRDMLTETIMSKLQQFLYVEVANQSPKNLWLEYEKLESAYENFSMQRVNSPKDIYPVFKELFKKQIS